MGLPGSLSAIKDAFVSSKDAMVGISTIETDWASKFITSPGVDSTLISNHKDIVLNIIEPATVSLQTAIDSIPGSYDPGTGGISLSSITDSFQNGCDALTGLKDILKSFTTDLIETPGLDLSILNNLKNIVNTIVEPALDAMPGLIGSIPSGIPLVGDIKDGLMAIWEGVTGEKDIIKDMTVNLSTSPGLSKPNVEDWQPIISGTIEPSIDTVETVIGIL